MYDSWQQKAHLKNTMKFQAVTELTIHSMMLNYCYRPLIQKGLFYFTFPKNNKWSTKRHYNIWIANDTPISSTNSLSCCMSSLVCPQKMQSVVSLPTFSTHVWLLSRVAEHVSLQWSGAVIAISTHAAGVGLLSCVYPLMYCKIAGLGKTFPTLRTFEWSFSSVVTLMFHHFGVS